MVQSYNNSITIATLLKWVNLPASSYYYHPKTGKRGRPSLSTSEKMVRENLKEQATIRSGGKRGRPKSTEPKVVSTPKISSGKRGRPALSAEAIRLKAVDKAATTKRSGGKRGRPKSSR